MCICSQYTHIYMYTNAKLFFLLKVYGFMFISKHIHFDNFQILFFFLYIIFIYIYILHYIQLCLIED